MLTKCHNIIYYAQLMTMAMAIKSLNMMEKMMDPNIIDYYIINCAIPLMITIKNRYQFDFDKSASWMVIKSSTNPLQNLIEKFQRF